MEYIFQLLFGFIFLTIISVYSFFTSKPSYNQNISEKLLKTYPILGNLPDFAKNRHRFLDWSTHILKNAPTNSFTFVKLGKHHAVITSSPLHVEHIAKINFENHPKGKRFISLAENFLGKGIFNSDGDLWKIQRKAASLEFSARSMKSFVRESLRSELQARLIPFLSNASKANEVIDMQDLLERFTFDNVCMVAFGEDPACLGGDGTSGREFMTAFEEATELTAGRFYYAHRYVWLVKRYFNVGSEKRLRNSIKVVQEFAQRIIKSRMLQKGTGKEVDLLSRFINAKDKDTPSSLEFLRDVVISFILAGRDTTSSALSWFFWLLCSRPDVIQNILEELKSVRNGKQTCMRGTYDFEELREMHYLHAALTEAMRLYPPIPIVSKASLEDVTMPDGTFVGQGWSIAYNVYAMGRMENIWGENCNEFMPERWLENGVFQPDTPFRYAVFHAGPRMCLGKDMAYIQMKSIAASVIENFEMQPVDGAITPHIALSISLRMKDGFMVRVKERCVNDVDNVTELSL